MSQRICSVDGCEKPAKCRGWCNLHYQRVYRHGEPGDVQSLRAPLAERWAAKVARSDDPEACWKWLGYCTPNGYGSIFADGKPRGAHRIAYEHFIGPIPDGMQLDHRCRNRGCVNPAHLRIVTQKQNLEHIDKPRSNTTGYRGVHLDKRRGKWWVRVTHNGQHHYRGEFATAEEANEAAIALRNELHTHNDLDRIVYG